MFFHCRNLVVQEFVRFENKNYNYEMSGLVEAADLFTPHPLLFFIFLRQDEINYEKMGLGLLRLCRDFQALCFHKKECLSYSGTLEENSSKYREIRLSRE